MNILVYRGAGVGRLCLPYIVNALQFFLKDPYRLLPVDHSFFLSPDWEKTARLVVFPGGRDSLYHDKLKGEANQRIRRFVERGGSYLGICAGGYYGASEIEFEKGGPLEICAHRELAFFPGKAVGPAYGNGFFDYESDAGVRAAKVKWKGALSDVYFNGGCFFENSGRSKNTKVIARYADLKGNPPAMVLCSVGSGKALLSGVHPEWELVKNKNLFGYIISLIIP